MRFIGSSSAPEASEDELVFHMTTGRRIEADDERRRTSLVRYLSRPPFAEAQLEWLDDERLRLTFRSPTRGVRCRLGHPRLRRWNIGLDVYNNDGLVVPLAQAEGGKTTLAQSEGYFGAEPPEKFAAIKTRSAYGAAPTRGAA